LVYSDDFLRIRYPVEPLSDEYSLLSRSCRAFNRLGGFLTPRGRLDVDQLLEEASRITGLRDWGGEDFLEPLRVLNRSYSDDAELSPVGRWLNRRAQLRRLTVRLRLQAESASCRGIEETPFPAGLFVTGLPRTGTTLLHRLLAQDPRARSFQAWELTLPCPPPDPGSYSTDPRRETVAKALRLRQNLIYSKPGWEVFQAVHPFSETEPEECWLLMEASFRTGAFFLQDRLYGYEEWLRDQSFEPAYRFYRRGLRVLTSRLGGTHLVLKSPDHLARIDTLTGVFPEARVIVTHRDLREALPSLCQLFFVLRQLKSSRIDLRKTGTEALAWARRTIEQSISAREQTPPSRVLDISFRELVADPMSIVRRVYRFAEMELGPKAESQMAAWLKRNHPHRARGSWKSMLPEFGLTDSILQGFVEEMTDYTDRFGPLLK